MKTVAVATDLSKRGESALDRAAAIAEANGAALVVLHAVDDDLPEEIIADRVRAADAYLAGATARRALPGGLRHRVVTGDIFRALQGAAVEEGAELIVTGDHRRSLLRDAFRDTTVERLLRVATVPVLIARTPSEGPYRHGLIGVEGGEAAELIRAADRLGGEAPRQLTVLHAFDAVGTGLAAYAGVERSKIAAYRSRIADEVAERLQATLDRDTRARVRLRVVEGDPEAAFEAAVEEKGCDLVVVSTHARHPLMRGILGSVSSALVRRGTRDLLVVPRTAAETATALNPELDPA